MADNMITMPTSAGTAESELDAAYSTWGRLMADHPELPAARFVAPARGRYPCASQAWDARPLVIIVPPGQPRDPHSLTEFALHAAAHVIDVARNGPAVGSQGRYHSSAFRDIARDELGLEVTGSSTGGLGWSTTRLPGGTPSH